jgi:hypothetical protein
MFTDVKLAIALEAAVNPAEVTEIPSTSNLKAVL